MYAKYHTEALVLGMHSLGEADRRATLYTREFGLVRGRAAAVRREESRMRYALQSFSYARVSLIRGSTGWRVAGAAAASSHTWASQHGLSSFARIARLVTTLIHGEEKHEKLFSVIVGARNALSQATTHTHTTLELLSVARILHALGYLSSEALSSALFTDTCFSSGTLIETEQHKDAILASINLALSEMDL